MNPPSPSEDIISIQSMHLLCYSLISSLQNCQNSHHPNSCIPRVAFFLDLNVLEQKRTSNVVQPIPPIFTQSITGDGVLIV